MASERGAGAGVHLTSSPVDWYAARAGGVVAYILLTAVVCLGLALAGRAPRKRWPRFAVEDVHRFGGLLVGSFIVLHVLAIAVDSYLPFSLTQLAVPFVSSYRPLWTGLGIVAAELLLALAFTNRYRRRLPHRLWRRAHYLNFAVWAGATAHALGGGTDRSTPWLATLVATSAGAVVAVVGWRLARQYLPQGRPRAVILGVLGAGVAALAVFVAVGPLRFRPAPWNASVFRDGLTGQILVQSGVGKGIVSMAGQGRGRQRVLVRADLLVSSRRLAATSFQLEYLPSGLYCRGEVTKVRSFGFTGTCRLPDGSRRFVEASWQPASTSRLHGVIAVHA